MLFHQTQAAVAGTALIEPSVQLSTFSCCAIGQCAAIQAASVRHHSWSLQTLVPYVVESLNDCVKAGKKELILHRQTPRKEARSSQRHSLEGTYPSLLRRLASCNHGRQSSSLGGQSIEPSGRRRESPAQGAGGVRRRTGLAHALDSHQGHAICTLRTPVTERRLSKKRSPTQGLVGFHSIVRLERLNLEILPC
jgi:hypothetical protein